MGKAAFNEGPKLTAYYWNNLSAGPMLTGLILPYLALNYWIITFLVDGLSAPTRVAPVMLAFRSPIGIAPISVA